MLGPIATRVPYDVSAPLDFTSALVPGSAVVTLTSNAAYWSATNDQTAAMVSSSVRLNVDGSASMLNGAVVIDDMPYCEFHGVPVVTVPSKSRKIVSDALGREASENT